MDPIPPTAADAHQREQALFAADLKRHLDNEPVTAPPPSQLYRLQKMARRNKAATVGVASVALALVLGLGLAMAALVRERAARERERTQSVRADTVSTFIRGLVSGVSGTRLWAAGDQVLAQEQAMKELEGLYAEFMGRTPPARPWRNDPRWTRTCGVRS